VRNIYTLSDAVFTAAPVLLEPEFEDLARAEAEAEEAFREWKFKNAEFALNEIV